MDFKKLTKNFVWALVISFLYITYLIFLDKVNPDQGERYVIHAEDGVYYCENIQKVSLDLIGYHCNGKYPVVEFRSPHVVVHRGEGE
tara:strand:+ start:214 stop:474 length:261 start_codon:yes stop_codon:yes gene_type:complete